MGWEPSVDFPELTAQTTVPNRPTIVDNEVTVSNQSIQFSIESDATAFLYEVYLFSGDISTVTRIIPSDNEDTTISLSYNYNGSLDASSYILIYAYDENLARYVTAPSLFIKPNTFRQPFSTVSGGYGCFGSLNVLLKEL